jgi:hypothetical protein
VYFLDNLHTDAPNINEDLAEASNENNLHTDAAETPNEDMDEIARINVYDDNLVNKMFRNINFRDDKFVYTNLKVSTRHLSAKIWNAHSCLVCMCLCLELVLCSPVVLLI